MLHSRFLSRSAAAVAAALIIAACATPLAAQKSARQREDTSRAVRGDSARDVPSRRRARRDTTMADTTRPAPPADPLTRLLGSFTFRNLGPAAYSGRVTAIAVPTPLHKTWYIGAAGGGVWKTTNGGITWKQIGDSLGVQTIGDVAVAPSDSNVIWVGTGERNSLRSQAWGNGVHVSTDGGKTWRHAGLTDTRAIGRIVIDPRDANTVYVAALGHLWGPNAERGVYKTTDAGKTWKRVLFVDDSTGFVDLVMDPSNPAVLLASSWHRLRWGGSRMEGVGAGSGIWRTTDGGATWTRLTDPKLRNGLPTERMGRIGLAIAPSDPKVVYAMVQVDRGVTDPRQGRYGGVFRSADGGATWTQVNDLQAIPHYYYDEIRVDPKSADHVYVLASPLLESKDGGKTFAADSLHLVHVDNHALWIDPADSAHMILGNDGGAYVTEDGGKAWMHMILPIGQFYTVIVDSSVTPYRVCGGLQDNGVWCGASQSRDSLGVSDADWYSVNGGDGMWVQVPWNDPNTVYSEWQFGSMSRLDLRTWKRDEIKPVALDAGAGSGYDFTWGWTAPILLSQHDPSVLYVGANQLFRLTNRGDDWQMLGPDMTRANREHPAPEGGNTSYHALYSIAESPRSAGILWTGSDDGLVWVSRDTGKTWSNVTGNFPKGAPTDCFVSTIAASRFADATAYLTYDCHSRDDYRPHVWKTTDFGKTWTEMTAGLPRDAGSYTIYEDVVNPRLLWVGTETGPYVTVDGGKQWHRFGKNVPPVPVEKMAMSFRDRDLVLGTHGRGVWIANVAALEEYSDTLLAERAHLFAVPPAMQFHYADTYPSFGSRPWLAPNPPRGARISYWLKEAQPGPVNLVITSSAGDTVRTIHGPGYAGLQAATWDLTREKPRPREKGGPNTPAELKRVLPGEYVVRLTVGKSKMEEKITVGDWPSDSLARVR